MIIAVESIKFYIKDDHSKGKCKIEFNVRQDTYSSGEYIQTIGRLQSCWIEPVNGNCVKAFISLNSKDKNISKLIDKIKEDKELHKAHTYSGGRSLFYVDTNKKEVRLVYNCRSDTIQDTIRSTDHYDTYIVFQTKALAIRGILNQINRVIQIGGTELINLDVISKEVLEEFGFDEITDVIGSNPPMYIGKPDDILQAARTAMGYRSSENQDLNTSKSILEMISKEV